MDTYRSPARREAVQEWCRRRLEEWDTPHRTERLLVEVGGHMVEAHVTIVGEGAPRHVWLPGTGACAAASLTQVAAVAARSVAAGGALWALDLPGQPGLSQPLRPRHDTVSWMSAWLEAVLDHVAAMDGSRPVTLVASGIGAAVALSASHPTVDGRLLVGPGGLLPTPMSATLARDQTRWSLHADPASTRAVVRHLVSPGTPVPESTVEWLTLVGRGCKTLRLPRPLPQHFLDRIGETPLVVAVGEDDELVPAAALSTTVARRTTARVVVLDGCGHLLPADRWDQVLRILPS